METQQTFLLALSEGRATEVSTKSWIVAEKKHFQNVIFTPFIQFVARLVSKWSSEIDISLILVAHLFHTLKIDQCDQSVFPHFLTSINPASLFELINYLYKLYSYPKRLKKPNKLKSQST